MISVANLAEQLDERPTRWTYPLAERVLVRIALVI
jgi:hypothetical protein